MPIHLYWGDDEASRQRAVEELITASVDPVWQSINLSRLDGNEAAQAAQSLIEARTGPFGGGDRVVVLQRSPFCNTCPAELATQLEASLELIPATSHLVLVSEGKPDARLRTTKALKAIANERSFVLPAVWDGQGQLELVRATARSLGLKATPEAIEALAGAIGSDSARLASELEKLAVFCGERPIDGVAVAALVAGHSTSSLAVGEARCAATPARPSPWWTSWCGRGNRRCGSWPLSPASCAAGCWLACWTRRANRTWP